MEISTPNGNVYTKEEYIQDLENDNIVLTDSNKEIIEYAVAKKMPYIQTQILANRHNDITMLKRFDETTLSDILTSKFISDRLPEVIPAADIIIDTIKNNGKILLISDFDVDGVTSAAVGHKMLKKLFKYNNFEIVVNSRKYGKGISDNLTEHLLTYKNVNLIMTSDHASSDKKNLTILRDAFFCKVIVTDHHLFDDIQAPFNMDVFINPQRHDNEFTTINGTHVLYYTLLYAFYKYNDNPSKEDTAYVYYLLNYVGLTIISDMMDIKNYVNKKILIKMLTSLNSSKVQHEPFWQYITETICSSLQIDETTIGYNVAPLLNSPGRIADPRLSFEFMIAETYERAEMLHQEAVLINATRKARQKEVMQSETLEEYDNGIVKVLLVKDAVGIQGIVSNNIMFNDGYKVVLCFTKSEDPVLGTVYGGSGRSQDDNLQLKSVLDSVNEKGLLYGYGGHHKAVGLKMKPNLKDFYDALVEEVDKRGVSEITTYKVDDYIFSLKKLTLNIFDAIDVGPYGMGFASPTYASDFELKSFRVSRKSGNFFTLKVMINQYSNLEITAFYTVKHKDVEALIKQLENTRYIRLVYNVQLNSYRNYNTILININHLITK